MSKKVQASNGLVKSAEVKTDLREKTAQKPKPKAADKTKAAKNSKETAKPETSAKPKNREASTKKGRNAAKSAQSEKEAGGSTKKGRNAAKSAQSENREASTKKGRNAAKSAQTEKNTAVLTKKGRNAAKSAQSEKEAGVSTKKGRTAAKSAQTEKVAGSTKKTKAAAKSAQSEKPAQNDDLHEQRKAVRTPQVMKLVENSGDLNPVLLAGKSRVPPQLRKKQSLTRLMRREMGEVFYDVEDTVVVNITELAIEHEAPEILDRFNACSCDKCVEVFSRIISGRVPARFARVNKDGVGPGGRELSERVAPMRKAVITEMIKELIVSKKRCFHDDTK